MGLAMVDSTVHGPEARRGPVDAPGHDRITNVIDGGERGDP
jgi:hypothetical protein